MEIQTHKIVPKSGVEDHSNESIKTGPLYSATLFGSIILQRIYVKTKITEIGGLYLVSLEDKYATKSDAAC